MALDIYFREDIERALTALDAANRRALALGELYGADPEAVRLCHISYSGALDDVGRVFGLSPGESVRDTLVIPARIQNERR